MDKTNRPSAEELQKELTRYRKKKEYHKTLRSTIWVLVVVAAFTVLCATFFFTVLEIQGSSMEPNLAEGQLVITLKTTSFESGDIIAFYYNNKILLKRVIGSPGQWVDINAEGDVFVDEALLEEPYLPEKSYGESDLKYPYQVPDKRWFVLGDHRTVSVDSRSSVIGTVSQEQVVGRVLFCIWPLESFGAV